MSGPAIFKAPFGASHGNGHSLVAVTGMSHGYTSREMLPHVMRFNYSHCKPQLTRIASALGGNDGSDEAYAVSAFMVSLGLSTRLRDVGVRQDQLGQVAAGAINNMCAPTRAPS